MQERTEISAGASPVKRRKRKPGPLKRLWRRARGPLAESSLTKNVLASLIASGLRFIDWTNPRVARSHDAAAVMKVYAPAIYTLWHGQHFLGPLMAPREYKVVAMFSRSADAEINALAAEKLGFETVRGSGGRSSKKAAEKGGARALIALKKALDAGKIVAMIADIPHGTPRQAGLGVVTLARISGRPVIPVAIATSRRKVLEKSWDKTTINLPFGRGALIFGKPVFVPADADEAVMEQKRREITEGLNAATEDAYRLVDGGR